eukprot:scaffold7228_cov523-Prasinococcus_capsulatus_cf.AAC.2
MDPHAALPLPEGWRVGTNVDPRTRKDRTYYYNVHTGARQWEHPSASPPGKGQGRKDSGKGSGADKSNQQNKSPEGQSAQPDGPKVGSAVLAAASICHSSKPLRCRRARFYLQGGKSTWEQTRARSGTDRTTPTCPQVRPTLAGRGGSGETFRRRSLSGHRQWAFPEGGGAASPAVAAGAGEGSAQELPLGWKAGMSTDPRTRKPRAYYYNTHTGQRQWDPPPSDTGVGAQAQESPLPEGWRRGVNTDPRTRKERTYYYNAATGQRQWDHPAPPPPAPPLDADPLPAGWKQVPSLGRHRGRPATRRACAHSPKSFACVQEVANSRSQRPGQLFYIHEDGRRQWERPVAEPEASAATEDPQKPEEAVQEPAAQLAS